MDSRCIAAAVAVVFAAALAAPGTSRAATLSVTSVRVDAGCGWAGGTWHFDAVTGTAWRSGGYAWCVSPTVAYTATTHAAVVVAAPYYAAPHYAAAYYAAPYYTAPYHAPVAWNAGYASRGAVAYDARTGTYAVGQQGAAYDRYTGNYAYGERGGAYNERTGVAVAGSHGTVGNAYTGNAVSGGRGVAYDPETGRAVRVGGVQGENGGVGHVGNDWYVGRNGNVQQVGGGRQRAGTNTQRTRQRPRGR